MKINNMKSSTEFIMEIESLVKEKNIEYIEAIILYCDKNNIEVETVATIIKQNQAIKFKVQHEAETLKMVKSNPSARLPI
jgi:1-deoxy-D-xylulose 5-phosphate reductoisomerase